MHIKVHPLLFLWIGTLTLLISACRGGDQPSPPPTTAPQEMSAQRQIAQPTQTVVAAPPTIPAGTSNPGIQLTLQTSAKVWLRVIADGEQVFEGQLDEGVERSWRAKERLTLRTSNAGGIQLSINGQPFVKLGPFGKVREREYRVEGGQVRFEDIR